MFDSLNTYDNLIIAIYLIAVFTIGLYKALGKGKSEDEYFLANRNLGWIAIGFSLFATNISSEHILGLSQTGASRGFAVGQFEWLAVIFLIMLGWIVAPLFIRSGVSTVPEFFGKRFDSKCRKYIASLSVFLYIFTKVSITLFAGSILLEEVLGWDMVTSVILMVLFTGLYTIIGGFSSVIYTQIFQAVILIIGALLLTLFGLERVGGLSSLFSQLPEGHLDIVKSLNDPDFPWLGILLGAPILGIWYWCTDQYIVQRILAAKNISMAKKGTLLAAGLKTIPVFLLILPGMISLVLFPGLSSEKAYAALLMGDVLPVGIKGIVISGLFAALMSSLASAFNSTAALITYDLYKPWKKNATENETLLVAKLSTILIVFISLLWIPLLNMSDTDLYIGLQSFQAYFSPPIVAAFLFGIFWKRITSNAIYYTLIIGGFVGVLRLFVDQVDLTNNSFLAPLAALGEINYLYFAVILFTFSAILIVTFSFVLNREEGKSDLNKYTLNFNKS